MLSGCLMFSFFLNVFLKVGENSKISAGRATTTVRIFWLRLNLPLGLNGNHALLAEAFPLQCHPTAKHCSPCKEVPIWARALATGSAAESDHSDTEVADRLTPHINLWTKGSWSDRCAVFRTLFIVWACMWKWNYLIKGYSPTHCFLMVAENFFKCFPK